MRETTPEYLDALSEGLHEAGATVLELGVVPTPMVYFARRSLHADGCAIVTSSHGPPDTNGLKWMVGAYPPTEADVQSLRDEDVPGTRKGGGRRRVEVEPLYADWLETRGWRGAPKRVVIDPGNGCWAGCALGILRRLYPDTRFSAIHDRRDGTFPDRDPDCSRPRYLTALSQKVVAEGADVGIAFDGDGDRVAFVDDAGHVLIAEESTWLLLQSFGGALRGRPFVHDLKFSDRMPEAAAKAGADPQAVRSGHAFIRTEMIRSDAPFGAEISGHYFHGALGGGDDGLYTACCMMAFLAASERRLSELVRCCPPVYITGDVRVPVDEADRDAALEEVAASFPELPRRTLDGIRIDFADGWALVRGSVTEAALTLRLEGASPEALRRIAAEVGRRLPRLEEGVGRALSSEDNP